jgi:hypothetical protein
MGVGRVGRLIEHAGEIHMAYRGQRRFPAALGAESSDASILVGSERGIQACGAYRFDQRWDVGSL